MKMSVKGFTSEPLASTSNYCEITPRFLNFSSCPPQTPPLVLWQRDRCDYSACRPSQMLPETLPLSGMAISPLSAPSPCLLGAATRPFLQLLPCTAPEALHRLLTYL